MAIVRVNFVKKGAGERKTAQANIRYIEQRSGKDGARMIRTLFGNDGRISRGEAYEMIDQAEGGSTYFRLKISPDPKTEDTNRDLSMQEVTEKVMHTVQEHLGKHVSWVAAIHADHTDIRHVHVLAIAKERFLPVKAMIQAATEASVQQRRELDEVREHRHQEERKEREEGQWELQLHR